MPGLTFMHGVFGLDRVPHSLTYGFATQMRNLKRLKRTSSPAPQEIYSQHENEKKGMFASRGMDWWNKPRSRRCCSPLQVAWHLNINVSQATSATPVSQERWGLLDYDVLDKNQNLICQSIVYSIITTIIIVIIIIIIIYFLLGANWYLNMIKCALQLHLPVIITIKYT